MRYFLYDVKHKVLNLLVEGQCVDYFETCGLGSTWTTVLGLRVKMGMVEISRKAKVLSIYNSLQTPKLVVRGLVNIQGKEWCVDVEWGVDTFKHFCFVV